MNISTSLSNKKGQSSFSVYLDFLALHLCLIYQVNLKPKQEYVHPPDNSLHVLLEIIKGGVKIRCHEKHGALKSAKLSGFF